MLLTEYVDITLSNKTIKYYEQLGYVIPRYKDKSGRNLVKRGTMITVKIEDLLPNSRALVEVECDYKGNECKGVYTITYNAYNMSRKNIINKDCCCDCKFLKTQDSNLKKYGTRYISQVEGIGDLISKNKKHSMSFLKKEFGKRGYILLSNSYIDANTPLEYICKKHSKEGVQKITYGNLSQNHGCYYCGKESRGEKEVKGLLVKNNIEFKSQFIFDDCRDKNPLPFDFAILSNNEVKGLIEYDGEFHYEPGRFSSDKSKNIKKFKRTKYHDSIKNQYCKNNKIPLLRIPYWEFDNIEKMLNEWLESV